MRLEANENIPAQAVHLLRRKGHDVSWAAERAPGGSDAGVLERACRERRLLVTFDKDFGEFVFRAKLPADCGVVLLRFCSRSPAEAADRIVAVVEQYGEILPGNFTVVEEQRVRIVPLPRQPEKT